RVGVSDARAAHIEVARHGGRPLRLHYRDAEYVVDGFARASLVFYFHGNVVGLHAGFSAAGFVHHRTRYPSHTKAIGTHCAQQAAGRARVPVHGGVVATSPVEQHAAQGYGQRVVGALAGRYRNGDGGASLDGVAAGQWHDGATNGNGSRQRGGGRGGAGLYYQLHIAPGNAEQRPHPVDNAVFLYIHCHRVLALRRRSKRGNTGRSIEVVDNAPAYPKWGVSRVRIGSSVGHHRLRGGESGRQGARGIGLAKCIFQFIAI
nr:hypothetical protein [Tanacetum cinerariifolium]